MRPTFQHVQAHRTMLRGQLLDLLAPYVAEQAELEQQIDVLLGAYLPDSSGDERTRIVVTGMGLVTPLGADVGTFWNGLVEGRSGVAPVSLPDMDSVPSKIAAEVKDFEPRAFIDAKDARRMSRASQFAVAAARMAIQDAALTITDANRREMGVIMANGSTSPADTEQFVRTALERGPSRVNPFYITMALPHMPSCQVAMQLGLMGYITAISTACAASAQAIGEAAEVLRRGDAQVMLAGGTEAPISKLSMLSFSAIRALSTRNDAPERASRPFDAERDGFVIGEGAGVLVLETLAHARQRGARIYAELVGYGTSSDAHHVTAPHPEAEGAVLAMRRALAHAGLTPQQIDYINAHATSTPAGDIAETLAIKRVFGDHARRVPISANKSMLGHLTSAAGAVEAAATVLSLVHGVVPPTINYEHADPACDLDYVPNRAREVPLQFAMSNSFGFGGVNAVLVFRRWMEK
ncbi:MAG TPA: beta-ketoacyl-ACP synthase II [Roseiflexaceae bacterium]|nr:beta-ketoacyl-ACP synthase II [Roseiflexaceae bacterium]